MIGVAPTTTWTTRPQTEMPGRRALPKADTPTPPVVEAEEVVVNVSHRAGEAGP